jgi:mannose-6-phosphate isomerase-like protein (cupin superfamily)
MAKNQTRRDFFLTAPLAAAATLSLSEQMLFASTGAAQVTTDAPSPGQFQLFTADTLQGYIKSLQAAPGNHQLSGSKTTPFTSALTVEINKSAKEFEYHEHRDHIFQIIDGTTQYQLGGTPQNPRSTGPGEWLAPSSEGAKSVTLNKGDMLVIPRGMAHKRSTTGSVTLLLISIQDVP